MVLDQEKERAVKLSELESCSVLLLIDYEGKIEGFIVWAPREDQTIPIKEKSPMSRSKDKYLLYSNLSFEVIRGEIKDLCKEAIKQEFDLYYPERDDWKVK